MGVSTTATNVVQLFTAPIIGQVSDSFGRKPFLLVGAALATLPSIMLAIHVMTGRGPDAFSLDYYFISNVVASIIPTGPLYFAWIADVMPEQDLRIHAFSILMALGEIFALIGMGAGLFFTLDMDVYIMAVLAMGAVGTVHHTPH
jgi:MFS family permease